MNFKVSLDKEGKLYVKIIPHISIKLHLKPTNINDALI